MAKFLDDTGLSHLWDKIKTALNAKANVADLGAVATSNDYEDLDNKPTIPAAQVNADWNASSGVARILNKPTIPTVNNATLTVQRNGTNIGTFTANAATSKSINIVTRDSFENSAPTTEPTVGSGTWTNLHAVYLQPGVNIVQVSVSFQYKNLTGYRRAVFCPDGTAPGSAGWINTVSSPPANNVDTTLQMTCTFNVTQANSIYIVWGQQNSGVDMVVRPRVRILRLP